MASPRIPDVPARVVRFGVFEAQLDAGELRRDGVAVKLQEQPFQLLAMLLDRPGEIVTREDLREKLWPGNTFVDFDRSLNTAVSKVRDALGDSAESPRFVQTLPRRGYRFICPLVQRAEGTHGAAAISPTHWKKWAMIGALAIAGLSGWAGYRMSMRSQASELPDISNFTSLVGSEDRPAFSPDGNFIAYTYRNGGFDSDIYVQPVDSTSKLQLTRGPGNKFGAAYSPDGRNIAFCQFLQDGTASIMLVPSIGGPPRRIVGVESMALRAHNECGVDFSPDGKTIAVNIRAQPGKNVGITLMTLETGNRRPLTSPDTGIDDSPKFSPDGRHVAFVHFSQLEVSEVYVVPTEGGIPKRVSNVKRVIEGLAWTSDGRELLLGGGGRANAALSRVPWTGGTARAISDRRNCVYPAISRLGNRLAFSQRQSAQAGIWRVDVPANRLPATKGGSLITSTMNDYGRSISPDGSRIAFTSNRTGWQLWTANSDGSNQEQVTNFRDASAVSFPRWSPDGKRIAFSALQEGNGGDIYVINADGIGLHAVTTGAAIDETPGWSNDGKWIYFSSKSTTPDAFDIWKTSSAGGPRIRLTIGGGYRPIEAPDGRFVYFSSRRPNGSELRKVPVIGGEETALSGVDGRPLMVADAFSWTSTVKGIYTVHPPADSDEGWEVRLLPASGSRTERLARLKEPILGIDVSSDGRWFLFNPPPAKPGADIMLARNFK